MNKYPDTPAFQPAEIKKDIASKSAQAAADSARGNHQDAARLHRSINRDLDLLQDVLREQG